MSDKVCLLSINKVFDDHYSIPLYQRTFAWGTEQIATLLQDIYSSYQEKEKPPYYVGSLVVKFRGNTFEVIDGQQRLTFFTLLTKILGINKSNCKITYESRELEQQFLDNFYSDENFYKKIGADSNLKRRNADLIKAIYDISHVSLIAEGDSVKSWTLTKLLESPQREDFINYVQNKVFLLRTEVSKNTDVTSYFEIMNNRGKQLQKHEIIKSLIMSGLGEKVHQQMLFGMIWDACSQMNRPIQKSFSTDDRKLFFGENWNSFIGFDEFKKCFEKESKSSNTIDTKSFEDLLKAHTDPFVEEIFDDDEEDKEKNRGSFKYQSIIDFPNFLMHVFKLFYDSNNQIALDEKFLMRDYKKFLSKIDPIKFLYNLFLTRTLFDRFIIKVQGNVDDNSEDDDVSIAKEDENFSWQLLEPQKYEYKKGRKTYFRLDYRTNTEFGDSFVKSLSMLQVTFRSRHHKNWLQHLLRFLVESFNRNGLGEVNEDFKKKYSDTIHCYIRDYFNQYLNPQQSPLIPESKLWNESGTSTPHFLFNLIDYLYWIAKAKKLQEQFPEIEYITDFNFRYHNSVEHHWARNFKGKDVVAYNDVLPLINNLGNLCLISKGTNSHLQDVSPMEKVQNRAEKAPEVNGNKGFPPKRQIMYSVTQKNGKWEKPQIEEHYKNVLKLLDNLANLFEIESSPLNSTLSITNIDILDDEKTIHGTKLDYDNIQKIAFDFFTKLCKSNEQFAKYFTPQGEGSKEEKRVRLKKECDYNYTFIYSTTSRIAKLQLKVTTCLFDHHYLDELKTFYYFNSKAWAQPELNFVGNFQYHDNGIVNCENLSEEAFLLWLEEASQQMLEFRKNEHDKLISKFDIDSIMSQIDG